MGTINTRNGKLVADFRYMNQRCREQTQLNDTSANRKRLTRLLKTIEAEILLGNFEYAKYFPNSNKVQKYEELQQRKQTATNYFNAPDGIVNLSD